MFTVNVTHLRSWLSSNAITWWLYAKKFMLCLKTLNLFAVVSRSLARKKTHNNCNYLLCAIFIFHEFIAWCVRLLCFFFFFVLVFIFQFLMRRSWCCVARGIHFNSLWKCCCFIFHVQLISLCTILRKKTPWTLFVEEKEEEEGEEE